MAVCGESHSVVVKLFMPSARPVVVRSMMRVMLIGI